MKKAKKILILLLFLFVLLYFIFLLYPKYKIGYINNIGELEKKYPLCHITNFKSASPLVFIEKRQWATWDIVVWGIFQDDINVFTNDTRSHDVKIYYNSNPFFVYSYAYDYGNSKLSPEYRLPIKKVMTAKSNSGYDYRFIDNDNIENTTSQYIQIEGYIESTYFSINIDQISKKFVLNLEISH